jgi:DNA-binding transcriptional MerR regulator
MSIEIEGKRYYNTSEACRQAGVSRATLFRWLKNGLLQKRYRDRRGWRLFAEEDLATIRAEAQKIVIEYGCSGIKSLRSPSAAQPTELIDAFDD